MQGLLTELNEAQHTLNSMQASLADTVSSFSDSPISSTAAEDTLLGVLTQMAHVPDELSERVDQLRQESFRGTDRDRSVTVVLTDTCTDMSLDLDIDALTGVPLDEVARRVLEAHAAAAAQFRLQYKQTQDWTDQSAAPLRAYAERIGAPSPTASSSP